MTLEKEFKIDSAEGMHARPAGLFVKTVAPFKSSVEIVHKDNRKNAKSIMSLMSLGVASGDSVTIVVVGDDAKEAMAAVENLFSKRFEI